MCTVLVVDDCLTIRRKTELILHHAGRHTVHSVSSGAEAIETAIANPPDVIIMDVVMADMDGVETLHSLRDRCITCPVLAYTARPERKPGEFTSKGFSAYVSKAENLSNLLATVTSVTGGGRVLVQEQ